MHTDMWLMHNCKLWFWQIYKKWLQHLWSHLLFQTLVITSSKDSLYFDSPWKEAGLYGCFSTEIAMWFEIKSKKDDISSLWAWDVGACNARSLASLNRPAREIIDRDDRTIARESYKWRWWWRWKCMEVEMDERKQRWREAQRILTIPCHPVVWVIPDFRCTDRCLFKWFQLVCELPQLIPRGTE